LVETDSPYLTPVPNRGRPNSPAYTYYVAEKLAEIRNTSISEIAKVTTENFNRLFFS
jgi:TatD DNase family protein